MSFLDKLKSVFIEVDTKGEPQGSKEKEDNQAAIVGETAGQINYDHRPNEKFVEILSQVLENNNQPGFDYLEYKKAVLSVAKLQNLDEAGQFRTAFAAAQALGVQPSALIESAKKYLSILAAEEENFNRSANQYLSQQISSKEAETVQIKQAIQQKEQQVLQWQKELESHRSRLSQIESDLQQAKVKLESNKASFKASYRQCVDQITSDIRKMEQYLK